MVLLNKHYRDIFSLSGTDVSFSLMSIGSFCRTRYQIDQFMSKVSPDYKGSSLFFDWLKYGGLQGVINLFDRDLSLIKGDIVTGAHNGRFLPLDKESGMVFLHDFGAQNKPWESHLDCRLAIDEHMDKSLAKYRHLASKTNTYLSQSNVALVYHGMVSEQAHLPILIDDLLLLLSHKYEKNYIFINVIEDGIGNHIVGDRILTVAMTDDRNPKNGTPRWWEGWDESWHRAFSSIFMTEK